MSEKNKHEIMKEGFATWQKLALARMGIAATGIAEDKREALNLVLEAAFEAGFSFGVNVIMGEVVNDIKKAMNGGEHAIVTNAIPMPTVGNA